jgi:hypothetical protein
MHGNVTVDMCVGIRGGCPITYLITADNQAEFSLGGPRDGCHYAFDAASLREFLRLGGEALARLDARPLPVETDCTATEVEAGCRS